MRRISNLGFAIWNVKEYRIEGLGNGIMDYGVRGMGYRMKLLKYDSYGIFPKI